MLAASVYRVYISQLVHVYAILGHVPNADTLWKELRCWHTGHYSKPTLFLGGNHCSKMSMVDISQIINPFPFYVDLFSFQNHRQDFSKTWGLVVSMLLVLSVFCVLFFFDHCMVLQCGLCLWIVHSVAFSVLFLLTTPASRWLLIIAILAILTYIIAKISYIRSDGIDVHFVYYINTISWFFKNTCLPETTVRR